ncbi:Signal recognition particle 14 kDa protein [Escovopsis weberi]|uniref:Signal recognition particle subunit SRP14 n=1 Tax=Escovopsis weberi TaxID=150374 RepID=A0A0M8N160_ESCWE|nr:Signal recognition particle 14 kDa protein [Escovopsis weberi]
MAALHISQDEFFTRLGEVFNRRKGSDHGAIYLTQKRFSPDQALQPASAADPFPEQHPSAPLPVIVHATDGKGKKARAGKARLSTVVEPHDLEAFYLRYADICKAGMTALKPRDKSKKKAKAKKKKATGVTGVMAA